MDRFRNQSSGSRAGFGVENSEVRVKRSRCQSYRIRQPFDRKFKVCTTLHLIVGENRVLEVFGRVKCCCIRRFAIAVETKMVECELASEHEVSTALFCHIAVRVIININNYKHNHFSFSAISSSCSFLSQKDIGRCYCVLLVFHRPARKLRITSVSFSSIRSRLINSRRRFNN